MTPQEIALVQTSYAKVAPIDARAADLFYGRLFEIAPDVRRLFPEDMAGQKKKLMLMLGAAVGSLDRLDALIPVVRGLGERQMGYGVTAAHFASVGAALLWTLEIGLGTGWTAELAEAWTDAYGRVAKAMIEGAESPEPIRRPVRQAAE